MVFGMDATVGSMSCLQFKISGIYLLDGTNAWHTAAAAVGCLEMT